MECELGEHKLKVVDMPLSPQNEKETITVLSCECGALFIPSKLEPSGNGWRYVVGPPIDPSVFSTQKRPTQ